MTYTEKDLQDYIKSFHKDYREASYMELSCYFKYEHFEVFINKEQYLTMMNGIYYDTDQFKCEKKIPPEVKKTIREHFHVFQCPFKQVPLYINENTEAARWRLKRNR